MRRRRSAIWNIAVSDLTESVGKAETLGEVLAVLAQTIRVETTKRSGRDWNTITLISRIYLSDAVAISTGIEEGQRQPILIWSWSRGPVIARID